MSMFSSVKSFRRAAVAVAVVTLAACGVASSSSHWVTYKGEPNKDGSFISGTVTEDECLSLRTESGVYVVAFPEGSKVPAALKAGQKTKIPGSSGTAQSSGMHVPNACAGTTDVWVAGE